MFIFPLLDQAYRHLRLHPCQAHTCQHGHCISIGSGRYKCSCKPGYTGLRCQFGKDNLISTFTKSVRGADSICYLCFYLSGFILLDSIGGFFFCSATQSMHPESMHERRRVYTSGNWIRVFVCIWISRKDVSR